MNELSQYKIFQIKFFGQTDTMGPRVSIKDLSTNRAKHIKFDYKYDNIAEQAINYLQNQGYVVLGYSWDAKNMYYIITEWDE